jgi:uncharacterized membrane protein
MKKCTKTLFTLSVVLNFLLLGALAGVGIKEWRHDPWHMAKNEMSPESRDMVKESFQKMHADMKPLFADMRRSREQMREILRQEQFNAARFDEVSAHLRTLRQQMGDRMSAVTKDMVAVMPPQDRQQMADHFVMGWKHGGKRGGWNCDKDKGDKQAVQPVSADQ